jgi:hypothetical protein
MTGASIFVINAAAQSGARIISATQSDPRSEVGAPPVGGPNGLEVLAGGVMLVGAFLVLSSVVNLLMSVDWRGPEQ